MCEPGNMRVADFRALLDSVWLRLWELLDSVWLRLWELLDTHKLVIIHRDRLEAVRGEAASSPLLPLLLRHTRACLAGSGEAGLTSRMTLRPAPEACQLSRAARTLKSTAGFQRYRRTGCQTLRQSCLSRQL